MQSGDNAPKPQRIGVPREIFPGEKRVATVPDVVTKLVKLGFAVVVEHGAGELADLSDAAFVEAGATIAPSAAALWSGCDIVFKVRAPTPDEVDLMHEGQALIGFLWPAQNPDLMQQLAAKKVTALSIDALPRTLSRAQKMDALTSMAGVSGYRAVVDAANCCISPIMTLHLRKVLAISVRWPSSFLSMAVWRCCSWAAKALSSPVSASTLPKVAPSSWLCLANIASTKYTLLSSWTTSSAAGAGVVGC